MIEFVFTFVILLAVVAAMSIGVMRGRAPISGSCGGLNNLGVDGACEICGGNPAKCEQQESPEAAPPRFYDATRKN
jgi:hypothetical protein